MNPLSQPALHNTYFTPFTLVVTQAVEGGAKAGTVNAAMSLKAQVTPPNHDSHKMVDRTKLKVRLKEAGESPGLALAPPQRLLSRR